MENKQCLKPPTNQHVTQPELNSIPEHCDLVQLNPFKLLLLVVVHRCDDKHHTLASENNAYKNAASFTYLEVDWWLSHPLKMFHW